jgi:hypothetical protein
MSVKELRDHIFEGNILDSDVGHRPGGEDALRRFDHLATRHMEDNFPVGGDRGFVFGEFSQCRKRYLGGTKFYNLFTASGGFQPVEGAVVNLNPFVDHDDTFTEFLDVRHVVAREKDGDLIFAVIVA